MLITINLQKINFFKKKKKKEKIISRLKPLK